MWARHAVGFSEAHEHVEGVYGAELKGLGFPIEAGRDLHGVCAMGFMTPTNGGEVSAVALTSEQ